MMWAHDSSNVRTKPCSLRLPQFRSRPFPVLSRFQNSGYDLGGRAGDSSKGVNDKPLARGVDRIRVTFHRPDTDAPESMYREFDIFGVPTRN